VAQPILKTALTVFADTVAILSCHGSKILHDGGFECKDDLTSVVSIAPALRFHRSDEITDLH
jgi:hypothetical protein